MAGIRLAHIESGMSDPTVDSLLQLVCRGIRRLQGDNQRTRLPITVNLLRTLKNQLAHSNYSYEEQRMLWAAFSIAFYGFLRVSEYTNLRWGDVSHCGDHISITLHQSKTDPFRRGCNIRLFRTNSSTCPCHAFERYSSLHSSASSCTPFLQAGRFDPLSCAAVTRALRQLLQQAGIDSLKYSSHSFRIGAATTAAAAGLPVWLIKNLGRWSSDAYLNYIHQQPSLTSEIYKLLSRTDASQQPTWDPDNQTS